MIKYIKAFWEEVVMHYAMAIGFLGGFFDSERLKQYALSFARDDEEEEE